MQDEKVTSDSSETTSDIDRSLPHPPLNPGEEPPTSPYDRRPRGASKLLLVLIAIIVILLIVVAVLAWRLFIFQPNSRTSTASTMTATKDSAALSTPSIKKTVEGLHLDTSKNYGNAYASGILPVGDNKYSSSEAKKGSVYLCRANFVPAGQAGAQVRGPWFVNNNTAYDLNKKAKVQGSVSWTPNISVKIVDGKRVVVTNDLPDHKTGVFPVGKTDPARKYDANPNTISEQSLTYSLAAEPQYGTPQCMGGEVGVMTTGVALFNAFDAGGRDAGAWEVQDNCDGHPQNKGEYHYHTLSSCITDQSVSKVIGYALDGFPITGPRVGPNNLLTTNDLDECHGIVSEVTLDGKKVTTYHYVMTQDFPYSVSCFRAKPVQAPGLPETTPGSGRQPMQP